MCRAATCDTCDKKTWWGCGQHVPAVMDSVPEEERCTCEPKVERNGKEYPPIAKNNSWLPGFKGLVGSGKGKKDEAKTGEAKKDDGKDEVESTEGKPVGKQGQTVAGSVRSALTGLGNLGSWNNGS